MALLRATLLLLCACITRCVGRDVPDVLATYHSLRNENWMGQLPSTRVAVAVLTKVADMDAFHWLGLLHKATVVFIEDQGGETDSLTPVNSTTHLYRLHLNSLVPFKFGFWGASSYSNMRLRNDAHGPTMNAGDVQALEKALFFFCVLAPKFDHVWILEDDVLVPSLEAFKTVNDIAGEADLVSKNHFLNTNNTVWHWPNIHLQFPPPWYSSGIAAIRVSKLMLRELHAYAHHYGRLEYAEAFFNSVAAHANLTISNPAYLSTTDCLGCWLPTCSDISTAPLNWFHPIKNHEVFMGRCALSGEWRIEFRREPSKDDDIDDVDTQRVA